MYVLFVGFALGIFLFVWVFLGGFVSVFPSAKRMVKYQKRLLREVVKISSFGGIQSSARDASEHCVLTVTALNVCDGGDLK